MKKYLKYIWDNFEVVIMVVCLDVFILNVLLGIITRVFFNQPLVFTEEVSRYMFIWMVFLGLPYSTKNNKHISVTALQNKLPVTCQYFVQIFIHILTLAAYAWVLFYGIRYLGFVQGVKTSVLQLPKALVASIIPLSAFLMILRTIERFFVDNKLYKSNKLQKGETK